MSDLQVSFRTNILSLNDDCLEIVKEFLTSGISSLYNVSSFLYIFSEYYFGIIVVESIDCETIDALRKVLL